jgi:simple sugar transport system permease protein
VTATADDAVHDAPAADATGDTPRRRGPGRRLLDAYLNGSTPVLVLLAFLCALVVGAVLIVAADPGTRTAMGYFFQAPSDTFSRGWKAISAAYSAMFQGSIFNTNSLYSDGGVPVFGPLSETLTRATPLILGGLSVSVAFRAGLFNIGGQGQILAGAGCAGYVGFAWHLPSGLHVVVCLLAAALGGAIWGGIAGVLKALTGAHEVIVTIMLNYIAVYLLTYVLTLSWYQLPNQNDAISRPVDSNALLPHLLGDDLRVNVGLLIAFAAAVACWWLLSRSTLGFRLRAVGANQFAARTAGMSVAKNYIAVMLIAGLLMGLAGATQVMGVGTQVTAAVDNNYGFDAITVALLGLATPGGTVLAALLFGALEAGGQQLVGTTTTPNELPQIMEAVIVLFIAAPQLVRILFRLRATRGGGGQLAKGWNG